MKAEILAVLRQDAGYVSGQELCNKFGVSRTAIWKAIKSLKEMGYEIVAVPNKGYRLMGIPDSINQIELKSIRETNWVGQEIIYYDATDSTNVRAKELAEDNYPNGTVVVANHQSAGRGRRGRSWESCRNKGIYMSILLKPDIHQNNASMLTLVTALAINNAIRDVTGQDSYIKWPNDIIIDGKKVCGILTEMSAQFDYINHIVIGIGINVHRQEFSEDVKRIAGTIESTCGKEIHRAFLIEKILENFEIYYEKFLETEDLSQLAKEYNSQLINMHKQVKVLDAKEKIEGKALGITERGELIIDTWESRKCISSGEVSVRGIYGYVE